MFKSLEGKVCVVTGAAKSIGYGIAERYGQNGAKVIMFDINPEVEKSAEVLRSSGYSAKAYVIDITDREKVLKCFEEIVSTEGPVFTLANVAGIVDQRPLEDITPEIIDKQMRVNIGGSIFCSQGALKSMKDNKEGKIINFSSKSGKTGSALMVAYSAAKGGVIAMTQAMAYELAPWNIKVNCICPGITEASGVWSEVSSGYTKNLSMPMDDVVKKFTAKVPLGRLTEIEDLVDFVYFLTISGEYCTGQSFNVTGGREMH
jgi:NAD(P)-dependent dehydrogenase (short-subunit alcohol dehydrogenase family)